MVFLSTRLVLINRAKYSRLFIEQNVRCFSKKPDVDGRKIPKFELSIDEAGKSEIKTEVKDISSTALNKAKQVHDEAKQESTKPKTRRLRSWDKRILVKLGKYERIEDVPDEITISSKKDKDLENKVRAEVKEKFFKYGMGIDYTLWMLCLLIAIPVWYMYLNQSKSVDVVKDKTETK